MVGTGRKSTPGNGKQTASADKSLFDGEIGKKKTPLSLIGNDVLTTEEEGFEPPVPDGTAVFKTACYKPQSP